MRLFTSRARSLVQAQDGPVAPREIKTGKTSDQFTYVCLTLVVPSTGDIAQLVERRPCKRVVALTGWVPNYIGGNEWWYLPPELVANSVPRDAGGGPKHATEKTLLRQRETVV